MADILSLIALATVAVGCVLPILKAFRSPSEYSTLEKILYAPVYCFGRLLWRIEIVGSSRQKNRRSNFGDTGAVLVANHRNALDPFFLQLACGRRVHWMVASEYFKNAVFGPVLRTFQAIPTNRSGSDSASMKTAIRLASEGQLVGMFPEGRINRTTRPILKIRTGAGLVAAKANCPLLPCWIEGAPQGWDVWSGWFTASRIRIHVGQPLFSSTGGGDVEGATLVGCAPEFERLSSVDDFTSNAMKQSLEMAGHPGFPVELARKRLNRPSGIS